jgi:hypothetical protein
MMTSMLLINYIATFCFVWSCLKAKNRQSNSSAGYALPLVSTNGFKTITLEKTGGCIKTTELKRKEGEH